MRPGALAALGKFLALMAIGLVVTVSGAVRTLYRRARSAVRNTHRGE